MTERIKDKVKTRLARELTRVSGNSGGTLSNARDRLKRQYLGYGYSVDDDREARGLSTYVDRTVLETVEWAKPGLMRVFCGDEIIRCDPDDPSQEQAAEDATAWINHAIFSRHMFRIVHDVLTDGLMQRAGWCLAHAPKKMESRLFQYTGLTQEEAQAVLSDPDIVPEEEGAVAIAEYLGTGGLPLCDLTIRKRVETREITLEPIPPERVLISSTAEDVENARLVAYWTIKTASDLRREGYSEAQIEELPQESSGDEPPETLTARRVNSEDDDADGGGYAETENSAAREYRIYEGWLDVDINNDGIAEKVKATFCGEGEELRVLKVEEWPLYRPPLFAACSVPMPHQAIGLCLADLVADVQTLRTEITRQYLDNLALSNQGELIVSTGNNGDVEFDSLLARGTGAVHRIRGDAKITPLQVPSSSGDALQGLELTQGIAERRTGVSSRTQSLKADTLQNTATGAAIMEEAVNQRLELVARVYAETFFKPLGRYLLHLVHKYQDKPMQLRVKGRFLNLDPRNWNPDMNISVAVGLGTGDRSRLLASYQRILQLQQAFITQLGPTSPVKLSNIVYTCCKLAEAAGLEAPERFFGTEEDAKKAEQAMASQPPQPSPEQQKMQLEAQKAMQKMQIDAQKAASEEKRKALETEAKIAIEQKQAADKMALKQQEMQAEANLDAIRLMQGGRGAGLTELRGAMAR
ncbi:MAG: cell envelope integrity protein TolA [Desulfovibrionaceae bacterium]|nr:cell envelope integrity protein TolA [Desulfovibrionaceae bacterium]